MKRFYLIFMLMALISCSNDDSNESTVEERVAAAEEIIPAVYDGVLASDSSHLIEYVLPNLTFDTTMTPEIRLIGPTTIVQNNYSRTIDYELEGHQLISAQIDIRKFDRQESILKAIHAHLMRFNGQLHQSSSFQNWILPLNDRPLIEINIFHSDSIITIDLHRRQHI